MIAYRTRSFAKLSDFEFLGTTKPSNWGWDGEYKIFDFPAKADGFRINIEIQKGAWKIYIGKILTNRHDAMGRQTPFDLVGEGILNDEDAHFFHNFLYYILRNIQDMKKSLAKINALFDAEFAEDYVNGLDTKRHTEETEQEVQEKLGRCKAQFLSMENVSEQRPVRLQTTFAKLLNQQTANQFLSFASALLDLNAAPCCLVITDMILEEKSLQPFMEKLWKQDKTFKGLFLTTYADNAPAVPFELKQSETMDMDMKKKAFMIGSALIILLIGLTTGIFLSHSQKNIEIAKLKIEYAQLTDKLKKDNNYLTTEYARLTDENKKLNQTIAGMMEKKADSTMKEEKPTPEKSE